MKFSKFFFIFPIVANYGRSLFLGIDGIRNHSKYELFKKNKDFQKSNLVIQIIQENEFIKISPRFSRNVFGYTIFKIKIYKNEDLIYEKIFRLSSFKNINRNVMAFDEKVHKQNKEKVLNYVYSLLTLIEYSHPDKIEQQLKECKLEEPTSSVVLFNENGNKKGLDLSFEKINYKIKEPLNVIPSILNKHHIEIIKYERIHNHSLHSEICIEKVIIKLPKQNYEENLYKNFLKIESIYLKDKQIFNKDPSIFFIEFDKLSEKTVKELIEIKKEILKSVHKK